MSQQARTGVFLSGEGAEAQGGRLRPEVTGTCSALPPFQDRLRQRDM